MGKRVLWHENDESLKEKVGITRTKSRKASDTCLVGRVSEIQKRGNNRLGGDELTNGAGKK